MTVDGFQRNRSEGWTHAKISGHANEEDFGNQLLQNSQFIDFVETKKFGQQLESSPKVEVDGAKKVASIFGDLTTSKIDVEISWSKSRKIGVSLKKSTGGQVWLISVERFLKSLEYYTKSPTPKNVVLALRLFIGGTNLYEIGEQYETALKRDLVTRPKICAQETHQKRLVAASIRANFPGIWDELLVFFHENIELITLLSFERGLSKCEQDWADFVVYNFPGEAEAIFSIKELAAKAAGKSKNEKIAEGPRNGGSTIQLPTGFLQMHHPQGQNLIQFHHLYEKVSRLA